MLGQFHAITCQLVNVRGSERPVAIAADVTNAKVICQEQDDVGGWGRGGSVGVASAGTQEEEEEEARGSHRPISHS